MKAVVMVFFFTILYVLVITIVFRMAIVRERAAAMVAIFLASIPLFIGTHALTPSTLGFLPERLVEHDQRADLAFACLVYFAGFFGGVLQIYNLADRGLSLRLLIDIAHAPEKCLAAAALLTRYSDGKGIRWMYQKRIDDMISRRLVIAEAETIALTRRGRAMAIVFLAARRMLRLETPANGSN